MVSKEIYCPVRKTYVSATPEEIVRQRFIAYLSAQKGFPLATLAVEKELGLVQPVTATKAPERRADIVCFAKGIHPNHDLYPLLLVECKAVPLTKKVVAQVTGYNHYLQAYFVAIVNDTEVITGWRDGDKHVFIEGMPSYEALRTSAIGGVAPASGSCDFQELERLVR